MLFVRKSDGAVLPRRASALCAGYDLYRYGVILRIWLHVRTLHCEISRSTMYRCWRRAL